MKVISLFSGVGGFDLALERLGHTTVAYSEIDPWACDVMRARFPTAVNLGDITQIDWSHIERPDILCGGFPCQPHSVAGKRAGAADARDLWPECVRALRDLRPRLALFENVRGLLSSGGGGVFNRCLSDLADLGYDASWQVLSAAAVGAPHRRERVWIVGYTDGVERQRFGSSGLGESGVPDGEGLSRRASAGTWWPTPRTEDGETTGISAERRARGVADNLPSAVQWRTPSDPTKRGGSQTEDKRRAGGRTVGRTVNLEDQVEPRTVEDQIARNREWATRPESERELGLEEYWAKRQARLSSVTPKLNPDWVETLMGFPVGWTDPSVPNDQLVWTPFPAGPGPQYDWEPPRVTTRKDGRRKRLRCLGNAIVPACLEAILTGGGVVNQASGKLWPTSRASDGTRGDATFLRPGRDQLGEAVKMWPTPDAGAMERDNRSASPNAAIRPLLAKAVLAPVPSTPYISPTPSPE